MVAGEVDHGLVAMPGQNFPAVLAVGDGPVAMSSKVWVLLAASTERQVLDIGAERVADRRLHRVDAVVERFRDHVADVVDDVGIVAGTAQHGVGARAAVEDIGAVTADERVGSGCADQDVGAGEPLQGRNPRRHRRIAAVGRGHIRGMREERAQIDRAADLVHVDDGPRLERPVWVGVRGPRNVDAVVRPREAVEARDPVEANDVLPVSPGDGQVVDRHVAGLIVGADVGEVAAVLDAAHLDCLLREGARRADVDVGEGQDPGCIRTAGCRRGRHHRCS